MRYYDATIGRFLQTDPWGYFDGMNPYIYVGNNPIIWIDPWGLCREKSWWEKSEEGYYYGTGFGEEALALYAQRWSETGNPLWGVPGTFAALWTPETYQRTGWTLIMAAQTVIKVNVPGVSEPTHIGIDLPGGRNIIHYGRHVEFGRHIGIWFKSPFITRWHW